MSLTKIIKIKGDWQDVVDGCRATVKKPPLGHEPSDEFKRKIMTAEHEPVREIWIKWRWENIPYAIAMHWKTHIWPSRVNTSRSDRTGVDRKGRSQMEPVNFDGCANPQHLIDTQRKRLCGQADPMTIMYAEDLKIVTRNVQPQISDHMVPNCVYRCGCPEMTPCGKWRSFSAWMDRKYGFNPGGLTIQMRYDLYNEWFYEQRKGGESDV